MEGEIRKAEPSDIRILNDISIRSKMYWGYPQEWLEKWKADLILTEKDFSDQHIYKMQVSGSAIGFCAIRENPDYYEIMHLWILPEHIGKGYGRYLLSETLNEVVRKEKMVTVEADPNAEQFYLSQGFVTFDQVESYPKGRYLPVMRRYWHRPDR